MLSERLVTSAMRFYNKSYLAQDPVELGMMPSPRPGRNYVLYAHVPFCERLCPYCSFNRFLYAEPRARSYFKALRGEMRMVADLGYDFASLYIGGGTPTILLDELCETIDIARQLFPGIKEVSAETSPNLLNDETIDVLCDRVQRFSVGVQSFDDGLLAQMARRDKYGTSEQVFEAVRAAVGKFHSLNVDMIFNFPSQTMEMLERDIELVKATGANQTTFYPLMVSPKNRRQIKVDIGAVDFERERDYYETICDGLTPDFKPGSAWTFSREAGGLIDEYIVDYEEYLGIGSGALSFIEDRIYGNTFSLREYERRIASGSMSVCKRGMEYKGKARMRYRFVTDLFGLRLDKQRFLKDFGMPVERGLRLELAFMKAVGGIATDNEREITLTDKGRYLLLVMMREMLAASNDLRDQARATLPLDEKMLLFESRESCATQLEECLAAS
ncbi:MAG: coproporphyrinogen III oxidase family protein [Coriobacteriia bacterium]|nr:coproporphyrinogen III oxidase family protein [Coriobacteriia bacterium]